MTAPTKQYDIEQLRKELASWFRASALEWPPELLAALNGVFQLAAALGGGDWRGEPAPVLQLVRATPDTSATSATSAPQVNCQP